MNFFSIIKSNLFLSLLGILGIGLTPRNILTVLMAIELMLLGITLNFLYSSLLFDEVKGQIVGLIILTVAAAESVIGLAILIRFYQCARTLNFNRKGLLKS